MCGCACVFDNMTQQASFVRRIEVEVCQSLLVNSLVSSVSLTLFRTESFLGKHRTIVLMCHYARISEKSLCIQLFFLKQAISFFPPSQLSRTLPLPLTDSKFDIILRAECILPFSHMLGEQVVSQMLKEMTISEGGGRESEKFLKTAVLAQPQLYH